MRGETIVVSTWFKLFVGVIAAALCVLFCAACSSSTITGIWYLNSMSPSEDVIAELTDEEKSEYSQSAEALSQLMLNTSIEFKSDGSIDVAFMNEYYSGTYTQEGSSWLITMNDDDVSNLSGTYSIKDGKLIFTTDETDNRLFGFDVLFGREKVAYESEVVSRDASDEYENIQEIEEGNESEEADHQSNGDEHEHSGEVFDDGAV